MAVYSVGCEATLSASFKNKSGALADPTAVTLKIKDPTGALIVYTNGIVKDAVGEYHYDLALTKPGAWYYRWIGTGAVVAADEGFFTVAKSVFA